MEYCQLHQKDSQEEIGIISPTTRRIWECYGHDRKLVHKQAREIFKLRSPPKKISRREARQGVMQIMYSSLLQNISAAEALEKLQDIQTAPRDKAVFTDDLLLDLTVALDDQREEIFSLTTDASGRAHERVSFVERSIIYTAVAELLSYPQTDTNIIITEAVQIAKQYGADGGYKIVNGTLDQIVHKCKAARA